MKDVSYVSPYLQKYLSVFLQFAKWTRGLSTLLTGGSVWSSTSDFIRIIWIYHSVTEITCQLWFTCWLTVSQILLTVHWVTLHSKQPVCESDFFSWYHEAMRQICALVCIQHRCIMHWLFELLMLIFHCHCMYLYSCGEAVGFLQTVTLAKFDNVAELWNATLPFHYVMKEEECTIPKKTLFFLHDITPFVFESVVPEVELLAI